MPTTFNGLDVRDFSAKIIYPESEIRTFGTAQRTNGLVVEYTHATGELKHQRSSGTTSAPAS